MTPGARLAAAIELLEAMAADPRPADQAVAAYFRSRRYAGAKDRRAVTNLLYAVLRSRARLDWCVEHTGGDVEDGGPSPRRRALASLILHQGMEPEAAAALCSGSGFDPPPLNPDETALLTRLQGQALDHAEQPPWVRHEVPQWLYGKFEGAFGASAARELAALAGEAPLDLRVNTLKTDRAAARAALAEDGIEAAPTPISPLGLRVAGRRALTGTRAYRGGLVEVQDEASQTVALLTGARPGMTVVDLCAGAGGKTLALAAEMQGSGRLIALDLDAARLDRMAPRLERAGATVERRALAGPGDPWLDGLAGLCARVLVDAPCSGSGVWRRQPDARWRLTPEALLDYCAAQVDALDAAAGLVAPGGRLVYATCSLLVEENQDQAARFLTTRPDFVALDPTPLWAATLSGPCPSCDGGVLLSPARSGTDGFFVALFERRSAT